jgi:hypothetical protein
MRFPRRVAAAGIVSLLAFMVLLLPTSGVTAVDQAVDSVPPSGWVVLDTGQYTTGQTFTPAYPTLASIDLYLGTTTGTGVGSTVGTPVLVTLDLYRGRVSCSSDEQCPGAFGDGRRLVHL